MIKTYTTIAAAIALSASSASAAVISNLDFDALVFDAGNDQGNGTSQTAKLNDSGWGTNGGEGAALSGVGWSISRVEFTHEDSATISVSLSISDGVQTITSDNSVNQSTLSTGDLFVFDFSGDTETFDSDSLLTFTFSGQARFGMDNTSANNGALTTGAVNFSGTKDAAMRITATAVPEPSSTALLGLGGLALILRRRK